MEGTEAQAKPAKKPSGNVEVGKVAQGLDKTIGTNSEVSGHISFGGSYACWNDGAINFVQIGSTAFYCRVCGALNLIQ